MKVEKLNEEYERDADWSMGAVELDPMYIEPDYIPDDDPDSWIIYGEVPYEEDEDYELDESFVRQLLREAEEEESESPEGETSIPEITLTGDKEKDFNTVVRYIRKKSFKQLPDVLNDIVDDPKLKYFLNAGFGDGEFAAVQMNVDENASLTVSSLVPTQNEIDFNKSFGFPLKNGTYDWFDGGTVSIANAPIITFNGVFIIDGHHRWSELYVINPDAKIRAINFTHSKISPGAVLRNMQGAVALANDGVVVKKVDKGANLLDPSLTEEKMKEKIGDAISDKCVQDLIDNKKATDKESAIQYLVDNALRMRAENQPYSDDATAREYMPQTNPEALDIAEEGQTNI